jgi:hypothetical protein
MSITTLRPLLGGLLFYLPMLLNAQVQNVVASVKGGRYTSAFNVTLSTPTAGAYIRYTLDGNDPDSLNSPLYQGALNVTKTTVLRAKAFASGQVSSKITSHSYLFNVSHTFPIVSLIFRPNDFFGTNGIYPNYTQEIEVPIHTEFFEPNSNVAVIDQDMGVEIQGSASAALPQKSLQLKAKRAYGLANMPYKMFPELPYTAYTRLVLRNSGQDWNVTMFRDEFVSSLAFDLSDVGSIIQKPDLHIGAYRPAVVYYNGQYWGIHNIRERMKTPFVEQHFNLTGSQYDMVENEFETNNGDSTVWLNFQAYLNSGVDFSNNVNYENLKAQVDMSNFLDMNAFNVFIDHQDWPANNNRRWKAKVAGSKWRFLSYDFDFTYGLFQVPGSFNTGDATPNALRRLLDPNYIFPNNFPWSTVLFKKCFQNAQFRRDYVNRLADMMNTIFTANRGIQRLSQFENQYAPEINKHSDRWGNPNPIIWQQNLTKMKNFINNRAANVYQHVDEYTPEVTGTANVTVNVSPAGTGSVNFSTLSLGNGRLPFTGKYFTGVDIPVTAVAAAGYVFSRWSDASLGSSPTINLRLVGDRSITAIFVPEGQGPCANDVVAPTFSNCPTNISLTTTANCATANWVAPSAIDNCGTPSVSSNFQSGFCFPLGNTTVTYTATDARGNRATCSFTVNVTQRTVSNDCKSYTVSDVNNICATCPAIQYQQYALLFDAAAGATDCRGALIKAQSVTFEKQANGTAKLSGSFRNASTWQLITVNLTLAGGTLNPPAGAPVKAFCAGGANTSDWTYYTSMSGTYQEGTGPAQSISLNGTPFQVGTGAGLQDGSLGASAKVRINNDPNKSAWLNIKLTNETAIACGGTGDPCATDTQAPTLNNCPTNRSLTTTGTCASATFAAPTASDNCSTPNVTQSAGLASGSCFPLGNNTVTYRAVDARGNAATCSFVISVSQSSNCATETTPPTIANCPASRTLTTTAACATSTWAAPTATDNCSTPTITQTGGLASGSCFPIGTNTVTYRAVDARGNAATCSFNVIVQSGTVGGGGQDIGISVSSPNTSYSKFSNVSVVVTIKNNGSTNFSNVLVKFPFPLNTNNGGSAVTTIGSWQEWRSGTKVYEWIIPSLPANGTGTLTVPLFILNATGGITFAANLAANTPADNNAANNTGSVTLQPFSAPTSRAVATLTTEKPTQLAPVIIYNILPNPTEGELVVGVESIIEGEVKFDVSNAIGKLMRTETKKVKKGDNEVFFDFNMLPTGIYFIMPRSNALKNAPVKFIKM